MECGGSPPLSAARACRGVLVDFRHTLVATMSVFPLWLPVYFVGSKINFCTRQFNNSATYNSFSEGHAIS